MQLKVGKDSKIAYLGQWIWKISGKGRESSSPFSHSSYNWLFQDWQMCLILQKYKLQIYNLFILFTFNSFPDLHFYFCGSLSLDGNPSYFIFCLCSRWGFKFIHQKTVVVLSKVALCPVALCFELWKWKLNNQWPSLQCVFFM